MYFYATRCCACGTVKQSLAGKAWDCREQGYVLLSVVWCSVVLTLQELKESGELQELLPRVRPLEERYYITGCKTLSNVFYLLFPPISRLKEVINRERVMLFMKGTVEVLYNPSDHTPLSDLHPPPPPHTESEVWIQSQYM